VKVNIVKRQPSELLGKTSTVLPLGKEDQSNYEAQSEERSKRGAKSDGQRVGGGRTGDAGDGRRREGTRPADRGFPRSRPGRMHRHSGRGGDSTAWSLNRSGRRCFQTQHTDLVVGVLVEVRDLVFSRARA